MGRLRHGPQIRTAWVTVITLTLGIMIAPITARGLIIANLMIQDICSATSTMDISRITIIRRFSLEPFTGEPITLSPTQERIIGGGQDIMMVITDEHFALLRTLDFHSAEAGSV